MRMRVEKRETTVTLFIINNLTRNTNGNMVPFVPVWI